MNRRTSTPAPMPAPEPAPALVAVAHGSRDPRSAATVAALAATVRRLRPELTVRVAFLDLSAPRIGDVLTGVAGDGHRCAVVVPLLLGRAYHAKVDLPGAVQEATRRLPRLTVRIADVLGPDPRLAAAALRRLAAAGVPFADPELGVVLAAAGSSERSANAAVARVAAGWPGRRRWAGVRPAFAAASDRTAATVPEAIAELRRHGASRIAVAPWFLAPGVLLDRVIAEASRAEPSTVVAAPLGTDPVVAELVLDRYRTAINATVPASA